MASAISKGASTDVIRQLALESGLVTLLGYSLELARKGETTLEEVGRMVLKLPLFGELILMTASAQFCRMFSSLTRAGVPILMSMEISSETAGNSIISDAILVWRSMVQEGVLLSNALICQKVLPNMALNMLAIGEETAELDKMLKQVGGLLRRRSRGDGQSPHVDAQARDDCGGRRNRGIHPADDLSADVHRF